MKERLHKYIGRFTAAAGLLLLLSVPNAVKARLGENATCRISGVIVSGQYVARQSFHAYGFSDDFYEFDLSVQSAHPKRHFPDGCKNYPIGSSQRLNYELFGSSLPYPLYLGRHITVDVTPSGYVYRMTTRVPFIHPFYLLGAAGIIAIAFIVFRRALRARKATQQKPLP